MKVRNTNLDRNPQNLEPPRDSETGKTGGLGSLTSHNIPLDASPIRPSNACLENLRAAASHLRLAAVLLPTGHLLRAYADELVLAASDLLAMGIECDNLGAARTEQ